MKKAYEADRKARAKAAKIQSRQWAAEVKAMKAAYKKQQQAKKAAAKLAKKPASYRAALKKASKY